MNNQQYNLYQKPQTSQQEDGKKEISPFLKIFGFIVVLIIFAFLIFIFGSQGGGMTGLGIAALGIYLIPIIFVLCSIFLIAYSIYRYKYRNRKTDMVSGVFFRIILYFFLAVIIFGIIAYIDKIL